MGFRVGCRCTVDALANWCKTQPVSGIVIDLTLFRNRSDEEIRWAIRSAALRKWLWRSEQNDRQARPSILRRISGLRG